MIWSAQTPRKLTYISSTTGRSPEAAAPTPAPMNPASDMGVSRTRRGPKRPISPFVSRMGPPHASSLPGRSPPPAMSSPIMITFSSRSISCLSASLTAWM